MLKRSVEASSAQWLWAPKICMNQGRNFNWCKMLGILLFIHHCKGTDNHTAPSCNIYSTQTVSSMVLANQAEILGKILRSPFFLGPSASGRLNCRASRQARAGVLEGFAKSIAPFLVEDCMGTLQSLQPISGTCQVIIRRVEIRGGLVHSPMIDMDRKSRSLDGGKATIRPEYGPWQDAPRNASRNALQNATDKLESS